MPSPSKPPLVLGLSSGSVSSVTRSSTTFMPILLPPPALEKNDRPSSALRACIEPAIICTRLPTAVGSRMVT